MGTWGYIEAFRELMDQVRSHGYGDIWGYEAFMNQVASFVYNFESPNNTLMNGLHLRFYLLSVVVDRVSMRTLMMWWWQWEVEAHCVVWQWQTISLDQNSSWLQKKK